VAETLRRVPDARATGADAEPAPRGPVPAERARRGRRAIVGGRGRPTSRLFELRGELPGGWRVTLATAGLLGVLALWLWTANRDGGGGLVPSPAETLGALRAQWQDGTLATDFGASAGRIAAGYAISIALGVVVGVAIGSLRSVEATLEAPIGFMRYVPATALTPLLLLWMGIGEAPKITLIAVGTVFFNILMVADVARNVPRELLEAAYTLGASRRSVLRRIVLRYSVPGIIDVARINLAAGWLMLVVAELLAAQDGLAFRIVRAQRFRQVDTMFAMLIVFGVIGVVSDLALRRLRDATSPWARP
jgi:NitT/TauT family transport system permease protein